MNDPLARCRKPEALNSCSLNPELEAPLAPLYLEPGWAVDRTGGSTELSESLVAVGAGGRGRGDSEGRAAGRQRGAGSQQGTPSPSRGPHCSLINLAGVVAGPLPPPGGHTFPIPGRCVCGEPGPQDPLHHLEFTLSPYLAGVSVGNPGRRTPSTTWQTTAESEMPCRCGSVAVWECGEQRGVRKRGSTR